MAALPQDEPIAVPASLVCTSGSAPGSVQQVTVRHFDGSSYEVEASPGAVAPGTSVVLEFSDPELPLVRARVTSSAADRLRLEVVESKSRDLREFPRMSAGIHIRYLPVPPAMSEADCQAWLASGEAPAARGPWREPDPLMEFSASGLAFEDTAPANVGDPFLVELQDPGGETSWRSLGRVVRADSRPKPDDLREADALWSIAVALTGLPAEAIQALLEHTVRLQERQSGEAGA